MAIVINTSAPVTKSDRVAPPALLESLKNRPKPALARKRELMEALGTLTPIDAEGNGPSLTVDGHYLKQLGAAAKDLGIILIRRNVAGNPDARKVWRKA